ncbi:hypothetical protein ACKWTF_005037 [Chironomus riparius]
MKRSRYEINPKRHPSCFSHLISTKLPLILLSINLNHTRAEELLTLHQRHSLIKIQCDKVHTHVTISRRMEDFMYYIKIFHVCSICTFHVSYIGHYANMKRDDF